MAGQRLWVDASTDWPSMAGVALVETRHSRSWKSWDASCWSIVSIVAEGSMFFDMMVYNDDGGYII